METTAVILLGLAALGGLYLAMRNFQGKTLPMPVSLIHGAAAAVGLVLVALAYFQGDSSLGRALLFLVVAALGGFFLFSYHLRGQRAPNGAVVVHALVAVIGFALLLLVVL